jgi:hypothetical protein
MPRSLMDLLCWPLAFFCQRAAGAAVTYEIDGKRYRMRHLLGEGGFSFVYKITDNGGGSYALKKILAQSEELLEGGLREIDVLRQFGGRPNIMPLLASAVTEIRPGVKELLLLLPHYERGTVQVLTVPVRFPHIHTTPSLNVLSRSAAPRTGCDRGAGSGGGCRRWTATRVLRRRSSL